MSIIPSNLDKWRNLNVGSTSGSREKVRTLRLQGLAINPPLSYPEPLSAIPFFEYDSAAESSQRTADRKEALECSAMIFEALSSIGESNGLDADAILSYIEERYEVPPGFRRSLNTNLRRLVLRGELEKVDDYWYKMKAAAGTSGLKNQNDKEEPLDTETLEDAARYTAYAVAVAENKSQASQDAQKEAKRRAQILEENMAMLKIAEELYQRCLNSPDGTILLDP